MEQTLHPGRLEDAELPYLDIQGAAWAEDPWATVAAVRAGDPRGGRLARSDRGIEILGYAEYTELVKDRGLVALQPDHWAEQGAGPITLDFVESGHLLSFEPERHLQVRRVMTAAFRRGDIERRRPWFREIAHRLVDAFADDGRCDLVEQFSHRYSIEIMCGMLGVPAEDIPEFERATIELALLTADPFAPGVPRLEKALGALWDYSERIVAARRREPQDDFISGMILAGDQEGKITDRETVWAVANLLFAGHDTTRFQLAAAVRALAEAGEWETLAADPELAPVVVEEAIRLFPVVQVTSRVVDRDDLVVDGLAVPRGTVLRFNWFAFNRDPERFPNPDAFDLRRDDFSGRAPFGAGVHKCLGHALARADLEEALIVLTSRLTDVEADGAPAMFAFTGAMGGPKHLPLRFVPRAR